MINQIKFFHFHKVKIKNWYVINARKCLKHRRFRQHQRPYKENQVTQSNLIILSSKSVSLTTDTGDKIWNKNKMFIVGKIDSAYNEIVYWKKGLFLLLTGAAGKGFIEEMTRLVNS